VIGDVAEARRLQSEYDHLRIKRQAGLDVSDRIASTMTDLLTVEARLADEGLYLRPDGQIARIPVPA